MAERFFTIDTDDFQLPQPIRETLAVSEELRAAFVPRSEYVPGSGGGGLSADPDHPGLYLISTGSGLTPDPAYPGLYLIGA